MAFVRKIKKKILKSLHQRYIKFLSLHFSIASLTLVLHRVEERSSGLQQQGPNTPRDLQLNYTTVLKCEMIIWHHVVIGTAVAQTGFLRHLPLVLCTQRGKSDRTNLTSLDVLFSDNAEEKNQEIPKQTTKREQIPWPLACKRNIPTDDSH